MLPPKERLSQQELQRRYDAVREKMKERGLEVLLISGVRFVAGSGYLRYMTNWAEPFGGEFLVFSCDGIPIFCARTSERAYLVENLLHIKAVTGSTAKVVGEILRQTGKRNIGICGLKTMFADFYVQLTSELSGLELVEMSVLLDEVRMVKSEYELVWIEKSARLTDLAFHAFQGMVKEGGMEYDVFSEVEHTVKKSGAENTYFMMAADPKPVPKFIDLASDRYQKGDLILFNAEIAGPGGYWTQLERTLSLGEPTDEARKAFSVCQTALEVSESLLRPGQMCIEIYNAIRSTIEQRGHQMGLHPGHSQGLDIFERPLIDGKDNVELKPGMVIVLHPHVLMPSGGGIWIGETYVITSDGFRPLHRSNRELQII